MRHSYQHDNWGHLLALTVAAACGSLLTWLFRRVIQRQRWQPRQTDLTEEHIANGHA
jgi:membrane protein YqaA with SNARE-associated domain